MRKLYYSIEQVEGIEGDFLAWHCTDGITTYWGETKAEAAAHFGCPVGKYDDAADIAALGRDNKYERY